MAQLKAHSLTQLADRKLEPYYAQIRQNTPEAFQNTDTSWKPFTQLREQVAALYYEPLINTLGKAQSETKPESWNGNRAAAARLLPYAKQAENAIQKNAESAAQWSKLRDEPESLANQWKLEKSELHIKRKEESQLLHQKELFKLPVNAFSQVYDAPNGDLYFFQLKERTHNPSGGDALQEQVTRARFLLSGEAQQKLLYSLLPEIQAKQAISFNYLNQQTSIEPEETSASHARRCLKKAFPTFARFPFLILVLTAMKS